MAQMTILAEIDFGAWMGLVGAAIGTLVGAVVTLWVQLWTHWQTKQFVAAERRLEAHQKAFDIWRRMAIGYHNSEDRQKPFQECLAFWNSNCLYLGKRTRKAFRETMGDVMGYDVYRAR